MKFVQKIQGKLKDLLSKRKKFNDFSKYKSYLLGDINKDGIAIESNHLLRNPAFELAIQSMVLKFFEDWQGSGSGDVDFRERLKLKQEILSEVVWALNDLVEEAEIQKQEEEQADAGNGTKFYNA